MFPYLEFSFLILKKLRELESKCFYYKENVVIWAKQKFSILRYPKIKDQNSKKVQRPKRKKDQKNSKDQNSKD